MSTVLRPSAAGGPPLPATNLLLQHQQQVAKARSTIAANGVATYDEENQRPNAGPRSLSVSHKLYGHDDKENAAVARSTRARTNNMTMMMGQQPQTTSLMHQKPRRVLQEIKPSDRHRRARTHAAPRPCTLLGPMNNGSPMQRPLG